MIKYCQLCGCEIYDNDYFSLGVVDRESRSCYSNFYHRECLDFAIDNGMDSDDTDFIGQESFKKMKDETLSEIEM